MIRTLSLLRVHSSLTSLITSGTLKSNASQLKSAKTLSKLSILLSEYQLNHLDYSKKLKQHSQVINQLKKEDEQPPTPTPPPTPRGIFLFGPVGTGKTLLMDLFFSTSSLKKKKRVHFHSFISSIHATLHSIKQEQLKKDGRSFHVDLSEENDPIKKVANKISEECDLLCFDEFQITDIADALILRNLLFNLFNSNTVVVATSNRPIRDLYKGGINYEYFEPTLGMIERFCREVEVGEEGLDFRREKAEESEGRSFKVGGEVGEIVEGWVGEWEGKEVEIEIEFGRVLKADKADLERRIGEFEFDELCDRYYGSSEYRAIGMNFDVVILKNVKRMTLKNHNQSRRFITLIDELYEGKCKLICNAEVEIDELFGVDEIEDDWIGDDDVSPYTKGVTSGTVKPLPGWMDVRQSGGKMLGELASVRELRFAFQRAGSRLKEMTSSLWWEE